MLKSWATKVATRRPKKTPLHRFFMVLLMCHVLRGFVASSHCVRIFHPMCVLKHGVYRRVWRSLRAMFCFLAFDCTSVSASSVESADTETYAGNKNLAKNGYNSLAHFIVSSLSSLTVRWRTARIIFCLVFPSFSDIVLERYTISMGLFFRSHCFALSLLPLAADILCKLRASPGHPLLHGGIKAPPLPVNQKAIISWETIFWY